MWIGVFFPSAGVLHDTAARPRSDSRVEESDAQTAAGAKDGAPETQLAILVPQARAISSVGSVAPGMVAQPCFAT